MIISLNILWMMSLVNQLDYILKVIIKIILRAFVIILFASLKVFWLLLVGFVE